MSWTRRENSTTQSVDTLPGPRVSGTNADSFYEGRLLVVQPSTFEARTAGTPEQRSPEPAPKWVDPLHRPTTSLTSPGLLVLAALAVIEGYRQLQLIPAPQWHTSAFVFAATAPLLAVVVTWPYRVDRRGPAQMVAIATALAFAVITPVATLTNLPHARVVVGLSAMALAIVALVAVLAGERLLRWSRADGRRGAET